MVQAKVPGTQCTNCIIETQLVKIQSMQFQTLFKPLNLIFWIIFTLACITRNTPAVGLKNLTKPIDEYLLTPLGFFHRGWGMFPSVTTGASLVRLRYTFMNGTETIRDAFPLRSRWYPSVWNEVLEDMLVRDDNGDINGLFQKGFFEYECKHALGPSHASGLLKTLTVESSFVTLHQLFTNYGEPYQQPIYNQVRTYSCER